jgi:hypothetical protein
VIFPRAATHSDRLERWLGAAEVAAISRAMRGFYWPIAMHGVPGAVYAMPGGDFAGEIRAGSEVSAAERARSSWRKIRRQRFARAALTSRQLGAFSNLSALIAAATGGKAQPLAFQKVGTAGTAIGNCVDLFYVGNQPAAGSAGGAAPTGTSPTNSTTGALPWNNPANSNTGHFVNGWVTGSVVANTLLLYDRLFSVAKTASSSATEAVTGTFSRYQSATSTNEDYVGGNFVFPSISSVISNTAHNWTVCQYTDQAGSTANSIPSIAGIANATNVNNIDLAVGNWFMPLASGDVGCKALTQMQNSSALVTGSVNFNVGHPIAFFPCPVANMVCVMDGVYTAFNLTRVYDNACLAFIEMPKPATTATTYSGLINIVAE